MNSVLLAIAIALLGGLGAVARFVIHTLVVRMRPSDFPLGTFVVNVTGAFALGALVGGAVGHDTRLLAGTAFLGAFTTFSTWMFDSERIHTDGQPRSAAANLVTSFSIGLGAVALGVLVGGAL